MKLERDMAKLLEDALNEHLRRRGQVTILIAGKTGVGKSTLVNAVFQGNLAETGQGRPVTRDTREINKEGIPVRILDTRGLELADYRETLRSLKDLIIKRAREADPNRHIHVAWVCIAEDSHRVEPAESELVEMLAGHVPTVAVITKAKADQGFRRTVQELLPQARNVVRVMARETVLDEGTILPTMGLENLIELTMELVPEGQRNALAAAQKVSLRQKVDRSHAVVASAALSAGGVGAAPIPFADAAAIVPIQISMLAGITAVWGLPLSTAFLATLVSGAITGSAATLIGRATVGSLMKLIPGAGSVLGGVISATTASLLTTAFGEAYIASLYLLFKEHPDRLPTPGEIREEFLRQLKNQKRLYQPRSG